MVFELIQRPQPEYEDSATRTLNKILELSHTLGAGYDKYKTFQALTNPQPSEDEMRNAMALISQSQYIPPEQKQSAMQMLQRRQEQDQLRGLDLDNLSDEQLIAISQSNPKLGQQLRNVRQDAVKKGQQNQNIQLQQKKANEPIIKKYRDEASAARKNLEISREQKQLLEQGNIQHPLLTQLSKKLHADWLFLNEDTKMYQKNMQRYLQGLKDVFGGRPAIQQMKEFMEGYPGTNLNNEQKAALLNNLIEAANIPLQKYQIALEEQEKDANPLTLERRVNERIDDLYNEHWERMEQIAKGANKTQRTPKEGFVFVRTPRGEIVEVPNERLQEALANQGELVE